jgi:hypothetical protein
MHEVLFSHPEIRDLNIKINTLEDKLDDVNEQVRALALSHDEFESLVLDELKTQKRDLETKLTTSRNKLLTSHNIDVKIKHYKKVLKDYNQPIEKPSEFPFKKFFDRALIHSRNKIDLILNPFKTEDTHEVYTFPEIITSYKIRQTKHESISKLYCL